MCKSYTKSYRCGHSALGYQRCPNSGDKTQDAGEEEQPPSADKPQPKPCISVTFTLDPEFPEGPCALPACAFGAKGPGWACCVCGKEGNPMGSCAGIDGAGSKCRHVCCRQCGPGEAEVRREEQRKTEFTENWLKLLE